MLDEHRDFHGRSEAVLAVTIIFLVLSSSFVFFRMLSRAAIVKKISIDDYLIVVAWIIAFGLSVSICYGCAWGLGRHESSIPTSWQEPLRKADYVFSVLYQPTLMATKSSILAFYLGLPTSNRNFKWASIATLVVVNAGGLALGLFTVFQCKPVDGAYRVPTPTSAHCTDIVTIYLSSAPLNIITDLALLFLPMPILTGMRLPRKQKIILIITFSFGAFVAIVDVVRIAYLQSAAETRLSEVYSGTHSNQSTFERADFSWYAALSFMWSAIEVHIGIMCACVPGLKPLVSRFIPKMLRDEGEPSSKMGSLSMPNDNNDLGEAQQAPSTPPVADDVRHRDFGQANGTQSNKAQSPDSQEEGEMSFMDFLQSDYQGERKNNADMGMMDFLTTPDMKDLPQEQRTTAALAHMSRRDSSAAQNFFDFVDMESKKSMVNLTVRESVFPIAMVTILFFIWGFEYGLLDVLNGQFQRVAHMSPTQSTGIHSAYFAGYFFGPILVGRLVLKHWGFKACYTVGLSIYACGTLIFWPAAVLTSFTAFVITNFIVAFGLSILEVSANPFIFLCGPQQYGEMRLNLSQGVQAIGSIVAPLIADKAFIHKNLQANAPSLVDTQWAYLGISLFTILLAVAYYYTPLPEATNEELEAACERIDGANKAKMGNVSIIWITLVFGVFSQFCYVGGQEVNGTVFNAYFGVVAPSYNTANFSAIAHTAFAASRFLAAGLGYWIKPRFLLLFFFLGAIVFEILAMNFKGGTGVAMITMVFFFEGPLFALIFAQSLRGMGRHTKMATVYITAAVSGGAVFSPISNGITIGHRGATYALVVGVAVFVSGTLFPIWLNISGLARKQVDPVEDGGWISDERQRSTSNRETGGLDFLTAAKDRGAESPSMEYKERTSTSV